MSGTAVAQLIPIAISPLLTRLYSPSELGIFALYLSTASIVSVAATGRYELAIMLPEHDDEAGSLIRLSLIIVAALTVLTTISTVAWQSCLDGTTAPWILFLPAALALTGSGQALTYWFNRKAAYGQIAKSRMAQAVIMSLVQIMGAVGGLKLYGLIGGHLCGLLASLAAYWAGLFKHPLPGTAKKGDFHHLNELAKKYSNFIKYSTPMALLNIFSLNFLVYVLGMAFDTETLGHYSLANRVMNAPLMFMSSSFSAVFFERIIKSENKLAVYRKSLILNTALGAITLLPFIFLGEQIFTLIFGAAWAVAGKMTLYLSPWLLASFAVGSVSTVFSAHQKDNILLWWQLAYLAAGSIIIFVLRGMSLATVLTVFSCFSAVAYLFLAYIGVRMLRTVKGATYE